MTSLSDRDRKILMIIVPIVLVGAFWFLVMGPKRSAAAEAGKQLASAEKKRDKAVQTLALLERSKKTFGSDYAELVRMGKAIPTKLDMAGLVVQLEAAAKGTKIEFTDISTAEQPAGASGPAAAAPAQPPAAPGSGNGGQPAAAGGAPAQSTPGQQAEGAGNGVNQANSSTAANTPAQGGAQQGGSPAPAAAAPAGACPAGLECVPLELTFSGRFFDLADFFHELKRFVRIANDRLEVRGRLLTVEKLKFDSAAFPQIKAEVSATAYLSPPDQGATAGASPKGPAQSGGAPAAPASSGQPAPSSPPTATAVGR